MPTEFFYCCAHNIKHIKKKKKMNQNERPFLKGLYVQHYFITR